MGHVPTRAEQSSLVAQAKDIISAQCETPLRLDDVAQQIECDPAQLQRAFRNERTSFRNEVALARRASRYRTRTRTEFKRLYDEAQAIIAVDYATDLRLDCVAKALQCSGRQLQRAYALNGTSFRSELARVRLHHAATLITGPEPSPIGPAGRAVGYDSPAQFTRAFQRIHGMTPSAYRQRMRARHPTQPTPALPASSPA